MSFKALDRMLQLKRNRGTDYLLVTDLVVRKSTGPARTSQLRKKIELSKQKAKLNRD
jgi:hypothetical protein